MTKISDWLLPKTGTGIPKIHIDNDIEVNTDTMETILTNIKGTGSGSIDDCASRLQTVSERVEFVNSRLNNIQNKLSANTDGSGDTLGQILTNIKGTGSGSVDDIASACNTISGRVEFVNSRLNNIQTAQTDKTQIAQLAGRTDIADDSTKTNLKCSATGSLFVKQDDHASVVVQGVSDQSNPFGTKKPLLIDTTGKLEVVTIPAVVRGVLVPETGSPASKWVNNAFGTTVIDTLYNSKLYLNYTGSQSASHTFELHGSNDNSTYYLVDSFAQSGSSGLLVHTSSSSGFRYFKIKNTGGDISTTQGGVYNAFH